MTESSFEVWIKTFLSEKGIDLEHTLTVCAEGGTPNFIPVGVIVENMLQTSQNEQNQIKTIIVKIDFHNGDILNFLGHLGKALAFDL